MAPPCNTKNRCYLNKKIYQHQFFFLNLVYIPILYNLKGEFRKNYFICFNERGNTLENKELIFRIQMHYCKWYLLGDAALYVVGNLVYEESAAANFIPFCPAEVRFHWWQCGLVQLRAERAITQTRERRGLKMPKSWLARTYVPGSKPS